MSTTSLKLLQQVLGGEPIEQLDHDRRYCSYIVNEPIRWRSRLELEPLQRSSINDRDLGDPQPSCL